MQLSHIFHSDGEQFALLQNLEENLIELFS